MKEYKVKPGQNIYDISLELYGSIEGVFDLLANNDELDMNTILSPGDTLYYDEGFIINQGIQGWMAQNNITVANGDPGYSMDGVDADALRIIIDQYGASSRISFKLSSGTIYIDWGDAQDIDCVSGTETAVIDHPYQEDGRHEIRIYGDFAFRDLDLTEIGGMYYALSSCRVSGTFLESTNRSDLTALFN